MKARIEEVRWIDASSVDAWTDCRDIARPEEVMSIGYVVKETDDHLVLALSIDPTDNKNPTISQTLAIPKGMIKKRRKVR